MSNTVKIKNKKKKSELKINYKVWAIVFAVFVAIIVGLAVWASFHWGVGMGTIGVEPVEPDDAAAATTEMAAEYSTDDMISLTPEQIQQLTEQQAAQEGEQAVEDALGGVAEEAAEETEAAEDTAGTEETDAKDAAAEK